MCPIKSFIYLPRVVTAADEVGWVGIMATTKIGCFGFGDIQKMDGCLCSTQSAANLLCSTGRILEPHGVRFRFAPFATCHPLAVCAIASHEDDFKHHQYQGQYVETHTDTHRRTWKLNVTDAMVTLIPAFLHRVNETSHCVCVHII